MEIRRYLINAVVNLCRDRKRTVANILLITVSALIMFTISIISLSIDEFNNENITNTVLFRTLISTISRNDLDEEDRIFTELTNDERISESNVLLYSYLFHIDDIEGINEEELSIEEEHLAVDFKVANNELEKLIIAGEMIEADERNVGLIPKFFYPDYSNEIGYLKYNYEYMNSEELIGKTITIHYDSNDYVKGGFEINGTYEYSFEVVGVYDNVINKDNTYAVYVPYEDFNDILTTIEENSTDNGAEMIFSESEQLYAIVRDYDDMDNVINDYLPKNIYFRRKAILGDIENIAFFISFVGRLIGIIVFIAAGIYVYITSLNSVSKRTSEIGMLKAVGYKNSDIHNMLIAEYIIISILGIFLFTNVSIVIFEIIKYFISSKMSIHFSDFKIIFDFKWYMITVVLSLLVPLVGIRKTLGSISEIEITEALKTNEKM
jgi:putative ABC transport system permease protein